MSRYRRAPAVVLVFIAGLLGLPIPVLAENVNVTNNGSDQNEPMVAIHPLDHAKLVAGFNDLRSGEFRVGWAWSGNGGRSWNVGGHFRFPGYQRGADPVIAFDNASNAYAAGIAYNPDNVPGSLGRDGSVFLAKSNDDGHSFGTFRKILFPGTGTATYYDKPWLHVNPANNDVNLVWVKRSNAWGIGGTQAMTIEFARSVDGGATFSAPVQVSTFSPATGTSSSHGPQVVSGSGQKIFVAWHTLEAGDPGIAGWVPPKIWIAESNDAGASFGTNYLVATLQHNLPNRFISLGIDRGSGRLHIAYAAVPDQGGDFDVYVATAAAAAGPWSSTRVNDDSLGNGRWQAWPSLGVAPNGRVDVIWYDQRDNPSRLNVYHSYSIDGGTSWAVNRKLTDDNGFVPVNGFAGDYNSVASQNEKAYAVWMDNRLNNQEIYGAEVMHASDRNLSPPKPPANLKVR